MEDLATALALAIAIEGAAYALFPATMRTALTRVLEQPTSILRAAGLVALAIGAGAVWAIRG